ncbi:MAG TPA: PfkB family carbohydrate kinase [Gemmataceae bacterium]|nr:PfkB family carbohydrate kinase [Gemmataceae bacterium]
MRPGDPLTEEVVEKILSRLPELTIGVLGDLFLDRYLDIDAVLTEPSIETGLDAYQVTRVRSYPGAAGTVINNLAALGVGEILPISIIGDDGEGYELRRALDALKVVISEGIHCGEGRRTPTYTKPMLCRTGEPPRELNRLDIKNRKPLAAGDEELVLESLDDAWRGIEALVVLDQVSEADCGVVTARVRGRLAELGAEWPGRFVLADSRERIGLFRNVALKPNQRECLAAAGAVDLAAAAAALARRADRPVFCTCGDQGILLADPDRGDKAPMLIAGYPVSGPIDVVGAGDSTSAGIVCARAAGATLEQAAAFGCLVASITVQQIGVTGTATPDQVRRRFREVR